MPKEFRTIDELLELLDTRNVVTDDYTRYQIMRDSYYAIVNGYKDPFLDKKAMAGSNADVYKKGTRFSEIYNLFSFDRDLRFITFKYLTIAESIMKTAVVYAFCEVNRDHNAYLERGSYALPKDVLVPKGFSGSKERFFNQNMVRLMEILNSKINPEKGKAFVVHYQKKYGFVPLWVLQNDLTFGNMAHFYQLQKRSIQNKSCKLILEATNKNTGERLTPLQLLHAFSVLVEARNLCAHDDRLYCAKLGRSHDMDYSEIILCLQKILPQVDFDYFLESLVRLCKAYHKQFSMVTPLSLLQDMGLYSTKDD